MWNWKSDEGLPPEGDFDDYSPNGGVKLSGKNASMQFHEGLVDLRSVIPNVSETSFTFEAPSGKKFVEIKMIFKEEGGANDAHFDSSGWYSLNNTWICQPVDSDPWVVTIKPGNYPYVGYLIDIPGIESIVFTLADDPNNN